MQKASSSVAKKKNSLLSYGTVSSRYSLIESDGFEVVACHPSDYILIVIPGIENIIADALSRLYPNLIKLQPGETPEVWQHD
jgi:hypothetical protein